MIFIPFSLLIITGQLWARGGHYHNSNPSSNHYGEASVNTENHYTHSYARKDGTYVNGYHSTNPNDTMKDNYSSEGNVNPYSGQEGNIEPEH